MSSEPFDITKHRSAAEHIWGDEDCDWRGINDAAEFLAVNLRKWGRVSVRDYKEKYGTVRLYCLLGWYSIHDLFYPGYAFIQWKRGTLLWYINYMYRTNRLIFSLLNLIVLPYHRWLYRYIYTKAVEKWPHLWLEILVIADYPELLEGIAGYKHSNYWTTGDDNDSTGT